MLRFLSLTIGSLCLGCLVFQIINQSPNLPVKSCLGFGWAALLFFAYYFALTKEEKWKESAEYSEAKTHYAALVSIGEDVRIAEERIIKIMTLDDIATGVRPVPEVGICKIRVSIFSDTQVELRILSHRGRVFGSDVFPKQKRS